MTSFCCLLFPPPSSYFFSPSILPQKLGAANRASEHVFFVVIFSIIASAHSLFVELLIGSDFLLFLFLDSSWEVVGFFFFFAWILVSGAEENYNDCLFLTFLGVLCVRSVLRFCHLRCWRERERERERERGVCAFVFVLCFWGEKVVVVVGRGREWTRTKGSCS